MDSDEEYLYPLASCLLTILPKTPALIAKKRNNVWPIPFHFSFMSFANREESAFLNFYKKSLGFEVLSNFIKYSLFNNYEE
jgi:hypothetical protein